MKPEEAKLYYDAILNDMHTERSAHRRAWIDLDQAIAAMLKVMAAKGITPSNPDVFVPVPVPNKVAIMPAPNRRFCMMSVRWAILLLLDEAATPMSGMEITEALEAGGIRAKSKALNFSNNVSAVLSNMKSPRAEVEVVDGNFKITDKGRSAIHHIKLTRGIA